jgi:hypothetical protein
LSSSNSSPLSLSKEPMDFAIHDSSLGKGYPSCDKTYSALLGTKPVEGLVLNQSTWAKSESNLRLMSSVLDTAEHFMAAAGSCRLSVSRFWEGLIPFGFVLHQA